jgi:hypothetical protein
MYCMHRGFSGGHWWWRYSYADQVLMLCCVHPSYGGGAATSTVRLSSPRVGSGFPVTHSLLLRGVIGSSDGMNVHHGDGP